MFARLASLRVIGALFIVITLVSGTFILTRSEATSLVDPVEPAFFAFGDEPFQDGLNHFLVSLDETIVMDASGPFRLKPDGDIIVAESAYPAWLNGELTLTPEQISTMETDAESELSTSELLSQLDGVESLDELGYGVFAMATSYSRAEAAELPGVRQVDEDSGLTSASVDEFSPFQWPLENLGTTPDGSPATPGADIRAVDAWHRTRGDGVVVAVIDSGIDINHPDLDDNIWTNAGEVCENGIDDDENGFTDDCHGWNFVDGDADLSDANGHGTHVAGIIAAEFNNLIGIAGVAPEATLMPLKIGGDTPSLSRAMLALEYAIAHEANIINASWISEDPAAAEYLSPYLHAAERAGILVVTGAGNQGLDIDDNPVFPAASSHPNVLTVAASGADDQPAGFSNFGSVAVDVFAPGDRIISTLPSGSYGVFSGTSMAAPHVAGAAALLWSATPDASYAEVKGALMDRSDGPNDGLASFRGLAASDGRLNVSRSIFTRLFESEIVYWFHDFSTFHDDQPHDVTVQVLLNDAEDVPPVTPLRYRATLVAPVDGEIKGIVGHTITIPGIGDVTTDQHGRAFIGTEFERQKTHALLRDGQLVPFEMSLPRGSYALVMEMLDVSTAGAPQLLGQASAVFFDVALGDSDTRPVGTIPPPTSVPITVPPTSESTVTPTTEVDIVDDPVATSTTVAVGSTVTTMPPSDPATDVSTTTTSPSVTVTVPMVETSTTTTVPSSAATPSTTIPPAEAVATSTSTTSTTVPPDEEVVVEVEGPFTIGAINPSQGPVGGGTEVVILGEDLPLHPLVLFGEGVARLDRIDAPEAYMVFTPPGPVGPVDITIMDLDSGDRVVMEKAFSYFAEEGDPVTSTTTTVASIPISIPTTTLSPPDSSTTTTMVDQTSVPTTIPPTSETDLNGWLDDRLQTPEGLTFGDLAPGSPLESWRVSDWAGAICATEPCRGWDL